MKIHERHKAVRIVIYLGILVAFLAPAAVLAGSLDSPAPPSDSNSAMYTISDIWNRLNSGAAGTKRLSGFTEPSAGPAGTGYTLDEVMQVAPAVDNTTGLLPSEAPDGKWFWSLNSGTWGRQKGSNTNVVNTSSGNATAADILCGKTAWVQGVEITGTLNCP